MSVVHALRHPSHHRSWIEVDLAAVAHNVRVFRRMAGARGQVMAVLKADAYGHGAVGCAQAVLAAGATRLGVASCLEGEELRRAGVTAPIQILGATLPEEVEPAVRAGLILSVHEPGVARLASLAALKLRTTATVHMKIDTGMGRLGILVPDAMGVAAQIAELPGLRLEGVFMHFADAGDEAYSRQQLDAFLDAARALEDAGIGDASPEDAAPLPLHDDAPASSSAAPACAPSRRGARGGRSGARGRSVRPPRGAVRPAAAVRAGGGAAKKIPAASSGASGDAPGARKTRRGADVSGARSGLLIKHAASSGAAILFPDARLDAIRPGCGLYGFTSPGWLAQDVPLAPALSWRCVVAQIKDYPPGMSLGYDRTYKTHRPTRVAVLPVGYADGYMRSFSNRAEALIHGRRAPIVGMVSMDYVMADVTGLDAVEVGSVVTLIGADGGERIRLEELAERGGTIPYCITTGLGRRPGRGYTEGSDDAEPKGEAWQ